MRAGRYAAWRRRPMNWMRMHARMRVSKSLVGTPEWGPPRTARAPVHP